MNLILNFFWFRGHLFGYFEKRERLRDFGSTLSSRLTKKLWKHKNRGIWWNYQNSLKIEHRIKGCWDICLRSLTKSENGKIVFFWKCASTGKKYWIQNFCRNQKVIIYTNEGFHQFFWESESVKEFWEIWEILTLHKIKLILANEYFIIRRLIM